MIDNYARLQDCELFAQVMDMTLYCWLLFYSTLVILVAKYST